jgi:hypothetical protein
MHTSMSVCNFFNPQNGYNSWHVLMWHCSYENTTAVTKNCNEAIFVSEKYILPGTITYSHHFLGEQGYNVVRLACFKKWKKKQ